MSLNNKFSSLQLFQWRKMLLLIPCLLGGSLLCFSAPVQAQQLQFNSAGEIEGLGVESPGQSTPPGRYSSPGYSLPNSPSQGYTIGGVEPDYFSMDPAANNSSAGGMGWLGRANYQAGKTVGTEESLLNFNAMPYVFWENTMFLGDLNLYRLNSGDLGGSAGVGVRQFLPNLDRTLGAIVSYNLDGTYQENFENITLSFESRGRYLDWLSNVYLPMGLEQQEIGLRFNDGSQEFVGNNIQFDQTRTRGYNLSGFDMMFGTPLPSEFAQRFDMRAYAGFYMFSNPEVEEFWGWSGKLEANALKYVDLNLTVTNDEIFETRVTFNASWTFDPRREYGTRRTTWDRMMLPTSRLYTVPKAEISTVEADITAINPETGLPYYIVHVDSVDGVNAPGAGTVENPFNTIDNAINGANAVGIDTYDIVFVHSGSTFDGAPTIVVPEGKRFLGEGDRVGHLIQYNDFGEYLMPRANGTYNDGVFDERPLFTNIGTPGVGLDPDGPAVTFETLASAGGTVVSNAETEFSGFVLGNTDATDPTSGDAENLMDDPFNPGTPGNGPLADGVVFADLDTPTYMQVVDINGANGDGLVFENVSGTYTLEGLIVNQSFNHEMSVIGGAPDITLASGLIQYTGDIFESHIINRDNGTGLAPDGVGGAGDNHDLLVQDTTGGSVIWEDVITNDIGGDGFLFTGSASNASLSANTYIEDARAQGVLIAPGTSGNIIIAATRTDQVRTTAPTQQNLLNGNVNYYDSNFNNFRVMDSTLNAIQVGLINNTGDPVEETQASVTFEEAITIDGVDATGNSIGFDQSNSGIVIANTTNTVLFGAFSDLSINYNASGNPLANASAIDIFQNSAGNVAFANDIFINNSGGSAVRVTNNTTPAPGTTTNRSEIRFSSNSTTLTIVNANLNEGASGAAIVIGNDTPAGPPVNSVAGSSYEYDVIFDKVVDIEDTNGMGFYAQGNTGDIFFNEFLDIEFDDSDLNNIEPDNANLVYLANNTGTIKFDNVRLRGVVNNDINVPFIPSGNYVDTGINGFAAVFMRENEGQIDFRFLDIEGETSGVFGINNNSITIRDGNIDTEDRSAIEIITTADRIDRLTNIDISSRVSTEDAPDAGVHLANVKGDITLYNGQISNTGSYGMIVNNTLVRTDEDNNDEEYFSRGRLVVTLNDSMEFSDNGIGFRGLAFDRLEIDDANFDSNLNEALLLDNVLDAEITGTDFDTNYTSPVALLEGARPRATIHTRYDLSLGETTRNKFYNFVVGENRPQTLTEPEDINTFDERGSAYAILMSNSARNNKIGVANANFNSSETGYIVNNNEFDRSTSDVQFQSFVYYRDVDSGNSQVNMNVSMNLMTAARTNSSGDDDDDGPLTAPQLGAIGFLHNSEPNLFEEDNDGQVTGANDNMTFSASDNQMVLPEEFSVGYYFTTEGDGLAVIRVNDTDNDYLTEGGDPLQDNNDLINVFDPASYLNNYNPDIEIAGHAFRFDLEADADIIISNTEVLMSNNTNDDPTADLFAFYFESIRGEDTTIELSNNVVLFETDTGPVVSPGNTITGPIPDEMRFVYFESIVEPVNILSNSTNFALYSDGNLTVPVLGNLFDDLFEANPIRNIRGTFTVNDLLWP